MSNSRLKWTGTKRAQVIAQGRVNQSKNFGKGKQVQMKQFKYLAAKGVSEMTEAECTHPDVEVMRLFGICPRTKRTNTWQDSASSWQRAGDILAS